MNEGDRSSLPQYLHTSFSVFFDVGIARFVELRGPAVSLRAFFFPSAEGLSLERRTASVELVDMPSLTVVGAAGCSFELMVTSPFLEPFCLGFSWTHTWLCCVHDGSPVRPVDWALSTNDFAADLSWSAWTLTVPNCGDGPRVTSFSRLVSQFYKPGPEQPLPTKESYLNINQVVSDLRREKDRINLAIAALIGTKSAGRATGRRGGISPAGRKRLSAAMKRRWAMRRRIGGASNAFVGARSAKRRGRMSAAARKRLSDAMKKRWAEGKMNRGKRRAGQAK